MAVKLTDKQIKKAIDNSMGNVSTIANRLGVSWHTAKKNINKDQELVQYYENELESKIDVVENELFTKILDGDVTAMIFFLKTKGRNRGYIEAQHEVALARLELEKIKLTLEIEQIKSNKEGNKSNVEIKMIEREKPKDWEFNDE